MTSVLMIRVANRPYILISCCKFIDFTIVKEILSGQIWFGTVKVGRKTSDDWP